MIGSGGTAVVSSAGTIVAAQVFAGGTLMVSSGGNVSGGLVMHNGQVTIDGTMAAGQTVSFAGAGGVLRLDNLAGFHAKISGLSVAAEKIDLGGFAFSSGETVTWTQSGTSGTLTVHDGAKTAALTLIGTYASSSFNLHADGHGGTFVSDAPAAMAAARFGQAVAGFQAIQAPAGPDVAVHGGGRALLGVSLALVTATSGR